MSCRKGIQIQHTPAVQAEMPDEVAKMVALEIVSHKGKIINSINDKGGQADYTHTFEQLATQIRDLAPAQVTVTESGTTLSPCKIWADNYNPLRPFGMVLILNSVASTVYLNGGNYYKCSDGYQTTEGGYHDLAENLDGSTTKWIIIYSEMPAPSLNEMQGLVITAGFFCKTNLINWAGLTTAVNEIYFGYKEIVLSATTLNGIATLSTLFFSDKVESIDFGSSSIHNSHLTSLFFGKNIKSIKINNTLIGNANITAIKFPDSLKELTFTGSNTFASCINLKHILFPENMDILSFTGASIFTGCTSLRNIIIPVVKRLTFTAASALSNWVNVDNLLTINNPTESFQASTNIFGTNNVSNVLLGECWNWTINLSTSGITINNAVQSLQNSRQRTGTSPITITFPASITAQLLSDYPGLIAEANTRNINIA